VKTRQKELDRVLEDPIQYGNWREIAGNSKNIPNTSWEQCLGKIGCYSKNGKQSVSI